MLDDLCFAMSAESRKKAEEKGQRSGKGTQLVSRAIAWVTGGDGDD